MSGGRFLVSLREVVHSEIILVCRSLIHENVNFWKENLTADQNNEPFQFLLEKLEACNTEIMECSLDVDSLVVASPIAGYIAKTLFERTKCDKCKLMLIADEKQVANDQY